MKVEYPKRRPASRAQLKGLKASRAGMWTSEASSYKTTQRVTD